MDEVEERDRIGAILDAMYEAGRQSALTVSPEKLALVSKALRLVDELPGDPENDYDRLARAAAIALGLRIEPSD